MFLKKELRVTVKSVKIYIPPDLKP